MSTDTNHHIVGYNTFIKVLISLLILTVITVWAAYLDLGLLSTTIAMIIASTKATIVLLYFMHLKFDQKIFKVFAGIVIGLFIAIMLLTFFDYFNR